MHRQTRQDTRYDGTREPDLRIGHIHVEDDKQDRQQQGGRHVEQLTDHRSQHHEILDFIGKGGHHDGKTHRHDDDDGKQQEHGEIVGQGAHDRARIVHLPNLIESLLNVIHQHQHGIEHEDQTDTEEDTTLDMYQITVHKTHNDIGRLRLRRQGIEEPDFDIFVIAEPTGDGKHHSQDGNQGQQ